MSDREKVLAVLESTRGPEPEAREREERRTQHELMTKAKEAYDYALAHPNTPSAIIDAIRAHERLASFETLRRAALSHQAAPPREDDDLAEHRVLITDAILCRVFEPSDYDRLREEWAAFDKTRWLHWSRAFGAFLNGALIARGRGEPLPAPEDAGGFVESDDAIDHAVKS